MNAEQYIKTLCPFCDGSIEFPEHGVGEMIDCPHCQSQIVLRQIAPKEKPQRTHWLKPSHVIAIICVLFVCGTILYVRRDSQAQKAQGWQAPADEIVKSDPLGIESKNERKLTEAQVGLKKPDPLGWETAPTPLTIAPSIRKSTPIEDLGGIEVAPIPEADAFKPGPISETDAFPDIPVQPATKSFGLDEALTPPTPAKKTFSLDEIVAEPPVESKAKPRFDWELAGDEVALVVGIAFFVLFCVWLGSRKPMRVIVKQPDSSDTVNVASPNPEFPPEISESGTCGKQIAIKKMPLAVQIRDWFDRFRSNRQQFNAAVAVTCVAIVCGVALFIHQDNKAQQIKRDEAAAAAALAAQRAQAESNVPSLRERIEQARANAFGGIPVKRPVRILGRFQQQSAQDAAVDELRRANDIADQQRQIMADAEFNQRMQSRMQSFEQSEQNRKVINEIQEIGHDNRMKAINEQYDNRMKAINEQYQPQNQPWILKYNSFEKRWQYAPPNAQLKYNALANRWEFVPQ
jgi:hypothetical protein